jgi:hypothetical protein
MTVAKEKRPKRLIKRSPMAESLRLWPRKAQSLRKKYKREKKRSSWEESNDA